MQMQRRLDEQASEFRSVTERLSTAELRERSAVERSRSSEASALALGARAEAAELRQAALQAELRLHQRQIHEAHEELQGARDGAQQEKEASGKTLLELQRQNADLRRQNAELIARLDTEQTEAEERLRAERRSLEDVLQEERSRHQTLLQEQASLESRCDHLLQQLQQQQLQQLQQQDGDMAKPESAYGSLRSSDIGDSDTLSQDAEDVCGDTVSSQLLLSLRLRVRALEEQLRHRSLGDTGGAILAMEMASENSSLRAEVEEVRHALRDNASADTVRMLLTHPQRESKVSEILTTSPGTQEVVGSIPDPVRC
uniref:Unconventional myosin-Vb-like n=1 Tax=Petromyzon marinus TaxID=7757 RepID=A0AAJ7WKU6_PETMA|nr:unconventional myosin-Vb-like [Petromyzon marinus]